MGPVAGQAKKGVRKEKILRRLQRRITAWSNPESTMFKAQISQGGAKCPGSWNK